MLTAFPHPSGYEYEYVSIINCLYSNIVSYNKSAPPPLFHYFVTSAISEVCSWPLDPTMPPIYNLAGQ